MKKTKLSTKAMILGSLGAVGVFSASVALADVLQISETSGAMRLLTQVQSNEAVNLEVTLKSDKSLDGAYLVLSNQDKKNRVTVVGEHTPISGVLPGKYEIAAFPAGVSVERVRVIPAANQEAKNTTFGKETAMVAAGIGLAGGVVALTSSSGSSDGAIGEGSRLALGGSSAPSTASAIGGTSAAGAPSAAVAAGAKPLPAFSNISPAPRRPALSRIPEPSVRRPPINLETALSPNNSSGVGLPPVNNIVGRDDVPAAPTPLPEPGPSGS